MKKAMMIIAAVTFATAAVADVYPPDGGCSDKCERKRLDGMVECRQRHPDDGCDPTTTTCQWWRNRLACEARVHYDFGQCLRRCRERVK